MGRKIVMRKGATGWNVIELKSSKEERTLGAFSGPGAKRRAITCLRWQVERHSRPLGVER